MSQGISRCYFSLSLTTYSAIKGKLYLVDPYPRFGNAAWEYFYDSVNVSIICRPSFVETCIKEDVQAFIFDGNVFGFREVNTKWQELERFAIF
jgi:hypothetical protein